MAQIARGGRFARVITRILIAGIAGLLLTTSCAAAHPEDTTDTPTPSGTRVPGTRVPPPTTPPGPSGCSGPTTPQMLPNEGMEDTRSEAKDYPRLRGASDIVWHQRTGRFRLELANPTCASWNDTQLSFFLGRVSRDPSVVSLEYASPSGWKRLRLGWVDPEEPEEIASEPLLVDFRSGERKAYDFRLTLPKALATPSAFAGMGARLDAAGEHAYEWSSTIQVESRTPQQLSVTAPPSVTPRGAPAAFTVEVHNQGDLGANDRVRLDLVTSSAAARQVVAATALFEMFRAGGWRPLDARFPATPSFSLPPGASRTFRFRVRLGPYPGGDPLEVGAQLRRVAVPPDRRPLAWEARPVPLRVPDVSALVPARPPKAGETAEFVVSVSNHSGVDYGLVLEVLVYGRRFVDRYSYRVGAGPWHPLHLPAQPQMPVVALPPSGLVAPDGFDQTYALRLEVGRRPTEAMNYSVVLRDPAHQLEIRRLSGSVR